MAGKKKSKHNDRTIAENKKARFDFFIEENLEAGLALEGWEVKSLRAGRANLTESYAILKNGERMLTTQLYVQGDPQNEQDFLYRQAKTAKAKSTIVTNFTPIPGSKTGELAASWDVILGMTPEDPDVTERGRGFGPPRTSEG